MSTTSVHSAQVSSQPARLAPIVIKIGGTTLEANAEADTLWATLAREHVRGPGIILVHGGGKAVDRLLARLNLPVERREGIRVTPENQIDEIVGVLNGSTNTTLVGALRRAGANAVGLSLSDGGTLACAKATRYLFDPGRVGEVVGADPTLLHTLLKSGFMPVLSSIGIDAHGRALNINADDAAAALATHLHASMLVLMTDVPGVKGSDGAIIPELTRAQIEALIASGVVSGGMIPKLRAAADVADASQSPVVILSADNPSHLAAVVSGARAGTAILPSVGSSVRTLATEPAR